MQSAVRVVFHSLRSFSVRTLVYPGVAAVFHHIGEMVGDAEFVENVIVNNVVGIEICIFVVNRTDSDFNAAGNIVMVIFQRNYIYVH